MTPTLFDFLDKAHSAYTFPSPAHNVYPAGGSHYSNISTPQLNNMWDPLASIPSSRSIPRSRSSPSTATYFSPITQSSDAYDLASFPPSRYPPHQDSHVSQSRSHSAYNQALANARSRSDQDIINSMLTPVLPDVSGRSPSAPTSASHGRVSWERSGLQGNIPSPLQSTGSDSASDSFQWSANSDTQFMNFDTWNDALSSPMTAPNMHPYFSTHGYVYTPEISPVPSPPPYSGSMPTYPDVKRQVSPSSSSSSSRPESRRGSLDTSAGGKSCSHCHATSTPLWRREPTTLKPLCNACGLYLQQRNKHRPQELIDADAAADDSSDESEGDGTGPECSHCRTHHTSVWRRSKTGAQLCNACGVYSRLRGKDRPLSLKRKKIKPRSKHTPTPK